MVISRLSALSEAVIDVAKGEDLSTSLKRLVKNAVIISEATYGALGTISPDGGLEEFTYIGLSEESADEIERFPEGKGLLGHLLKHPTPLRLASIKSSEASVGFPEGHPAMNSFLGVPIRIRDEVYGSLYLTEKKGGLEFTEEDEQLVIVLASAAGIAIDSARGQAAQNQIVVLAERDRIGRDLHDLVIQRLFATGLSLQAVTKDELAPTRGLKIIQETIDNLDLTVQQIRNTIFELQIPGPIAGLRGSIHEEIAMFQGKNAIHISSEFQGPIDSSVHGALCEHSIAVVRELLTNAMKHARCRHIDVSISANEGQLEVQVSDDGIGYVEGLRKSGLFNLEERAKECNGTFSITKKAPQGTRARWVVPY
jgi:signal transduction histidine kinase